MVLSFPYEVKKIFIRVFNEGLLKKCFFLIIQNEKWNIYLTHRLDQHFYLENIKANHIWLYTYENIEVHHGFVVIIQLILCNSLINNQKNNYLITI